ncbi:hypothetical protein LSH36_878g01035, partial [Paralvinella palmiformis]
MGWTQQETLKAKYDMIRNGLSEISMGKRYAMASAVRNLRKMVNSLLNSYKNDRFLADAEWSVVVKYVDINDPYETTEEE